MYCVDPYNKIKYYGDSLDSSKIICHAENSSLNSNKTDLSVDFKNLNLSQSNSYSDGKSLESNYLSESNVNKRILYTKVTIKKVTNLFILY